MDFKLFFEIVLSCLTLQNELTVRTEGARNDVGKEGGEKRLYFAPYRYPLSGPWASARPQYVLWYRRALRLELAN